MSRGYQDTESDGGINKSVVIGGIVLTILVSLAVFHFTGGTEILQDESADFEINYSETAELVSIEQSGGDTLDPELLTVYINGEERQIQTINNIGTPFLQVSYEMTVDEAESGAHIEIVYDGDVVLYDDTYTYTGSDLQT